MITASKQYKTQNGSKVRIYATDGLGVLPVHGAIWSDGLRRGANQWTAFGSFFADGRDSLYDLVEVKPRINRTLWISSDSAGIVLGISSTQEAARKQLLVAACVKVEIDVELGEGLE